MSRIMLQTDLYMSPPTSEFRGKVHTMVKKFNNMEVTMLTCPDNGPIFHIKSSNPSTYYNRIVRVEVIADAVDGYEFLRQLVEMLNSETNWPNAKDYKITSLQVREFNLNVRTIKFDKSD